MKKPTPVQRTLVKHCFGGIGTIVAYSALAFYALATIYNAFNGG